MSSFVYPSLNPRRNEIRLLYPILKEGPKDSLRDETLLKKDEEFIVKPDLALEFELLPASLDDAPAYTALSYVWGDQSSPEVIKVNGVPFEVGQNLFCALCHMQYKHIAPAIWIDAICINQGDNLEKNDQIPRMTSIYSGARDVLIWLGPEGEGISEYAEILHMMLELVRAKFNGLEYPREYAESGAILELPGAAIEALHTKDRLSTTRFHDLLDLLEYQNSTILVRDWWYPMLPQAITNNRPSQERLERIIRLSRPQNDYHTSFFCLRLDYNTRWLAFETLKSIYCTDHEKALGAKDDRDRIFALRGLAEEDFKKLGVEVDYTKQCYEIYIQFAQGLIQSGNLDVLSLCYLQDLHGSNACRFSAGPFICDKTKLPSWAPDWTVPMEGPYRPFKLRLKPLFAASGKSSVLCSFGTYTGADGKACGKSATLRGHLVDEVIKVGLPHVLTNVSGRELDYGILGLLKEVEDFGEESRRLGYNVYTERQLAEAVWRVPSWDYESLVTETLFRRTTKLTEARHFTGLSAVKATILDYKIEDIRVAQTSSFLSTLWRWFTIKSHQILKWIYLNQYSYYASYYRSTLNSPQTRTDPNWRWSGLDVLGMNGRTQAEWQMHWGLMMLNRSDRVFLTKHGYMGLGPDSVKAGDTACIFHGAQVPHILRKRDEGRPGYTLVGPAFVYGAMDGELMHGEREHVDFEIF
ncbi:hypothetical protein K458DRAFT_416207 [Lentithecium fluviatile CBS 122367]|uniref:Heterokaryon incompatibility domain-containing protein n=1 Tax=Lentithecium fluviatile CBS 122367 TaxID=1168545 RepID=A0A6G1J9N6_9PLEO|nr:hypothetical protein K458DRAFT_416207 [Lentithecium fluviatile CBS 122367]